MAFLELWNKGLRNEDIAEQFEVGLQCIRQLAFQVRKKLGTHDLGNAYLQCRDLIEASRAHLPLAGRINRRSARQDTPPHLRMPPEGLPPRLQAVLEGMAAGKSYAEVCLELGISKGQAWNAAYEARKVLRVETNAEAIEEARKRGWIGAGAE